MSTILSNRVQKVKPSATMAVSDKAKELKSQGIQIISMGSGEPDFDTCLLYTSPSPRDRG